MVNAKHQLDTARSLAAQYVDASLHQVLLLGFGDTPALPSEHSRSVYFQTQSVFLSIA